MNQLLTEVEKRLCEVSSLLHLIKRADFETSAQEITDTIELAEDLLSTTRDKVTSTLLSMKHETA